MKNSMKHVCSLFLVGILALGMLASVQTGALAANTDVSNAINVTGKGGVKVKPDIAYVSLGVSTKDKVAKTAQANNNKKITAILDKLKTLEITEADMNTTGYTLSPNYAYINNSRSSTIDSYTASCTIRVSIRDLAKVGTAVDNAISAGTTRVNSIQFAIEDPSPYYAKALTAAGKDARVKADAIASSLGVKIKTVLLVDELGTNYAPVSYNNTAVPESAMYDSVPLGDVTMPVQADELSVTASIKVTFSIQ